MMDNGAIRVVCIVNSQRADNAATKSKIPVSTVL